MSRIAQDLASQLTRAVATQGTSATFYRAKVASDPGVAVRFMLRHAGNRDEAIANAYGVNAQVLTFAHAAPFTSQPPEKFDYVVHAGGERYVFDAVLPRQVDDIVIGWTAYVRGKGA